MRFGIPSGDVHGAMICNRSFAVLAVLFPRERKNPVMHNLCILEQAFEETFLLFFNEAERTFFSQQTIYGICIGFTRIHQWRQEKSPVRHGSTRSTD